MKKNIKLLTARLFMFVVFITVQTVALADVSIIVHKANLLDSIDSSMLKSVYLGKLKSWPDGSPIMLADNVPGSDTRITFLKKAVKKSESKFDSYWSRKVFSGKGVPPKGMNDDDAIKQWVAKNKRAMGYVDASTVDDSVKVLITIK